VSGKHLPPVNAESAPFWDACRAGELHLQRCAACSRWQFYPRLLCTACGGRELAWQQASGKARLATFTIVRRAVSAAYEDDVPYVVALVKLEEGPTMMSNVVDCDPEALEIGMPLEVTFEAYTDEITVPQFRPAP